MYLRRLDVHGFKAFATRQRFEFGPGLTVIAGPNGSGKSNVADAIRWALGEQSQKSIRARKTEDVIFSGSDRRRPLGLAEVTLVLDNSGGWMPVDFSEVSVSRRAHRSGDNEYRINNQQVRLTDVVDLFRRAQVGQNSYAHMSQGVVDEVLALRPAERRELIEEAADLRRHRHQLNLSERRLVETRDNLGHVRMLIREVEPRIKQLQRQSRRAARYQDLATELAEALTVYFATESRAAREAQTAARSGHDQAAQACNEARAESQRIEQRLREVQGALQQRRAELERLQGRERELAEEGLRLDQAVALAEQRLELITDRRQELERAMAETTLPEEDDGAIDGSIAQAEAQVAAAQAQIARDREALASADEATRSVLRDLTAAETRRARLDAALDEAQRRVREHEQRREERARDRAEAERLHADAVVRVTEEQQRLAQHQRAAEGLQAEVEAAREARESAEQRLEEEQRSLRGTEQALREGEAQVAQLEERERLIEMLRESAPVGESGADALLEAARQHASDPGTGVARIVDTVSRLIRVPGGLETAIGSALAEHLSAVVVEDYEAALAAIAFLREHETGTATVYPLDRLSPRERPDVAAEPGVVGVAAELVTCEGRYRPLVDALLGRVIVVEDRVTAERLVARDLGSAVTREGVLLLAGGALYGGTRGAVEEQFALQRELDALPEQIAAAEAAVPALRQRVDRALATVDAVRAEMNAARIAVDEAEERRRQHEAQRSAIERRQAELASEVRGLEQRMQVDPGEATAAAELQTEVERIRDEIAEVAEQIQGLRDRSEVVSAERDAAAGRVDATSQELARVQAEHRSLVAQRDERVAARRAALEEHRRRQEQHEALRREQEDLELTLRDHRQRQINNRTARSETQSAIGPLHAAVAELAQEESELATSRGDAQRQLAAAERDLMEQEHRVRQEAERIERLQHEVASEGMEILDDGTVRAVAHEDPDAGDAIDGEDPGSEAAPAPPLRVVAHDEPVLAHPVPLRGGADVDVGELRQRIVELRAQIKGLGPVNLDALEDLVAEQERYEFLVEQVGDLEAAEAELRDAVRELKQLIRTRFVETFHLVNERFDAYFKRFFGGGHAELRLIEPDSEDEDAEAGVDIVAQPPGKRISNLAALSGGERSMTSVALLFALLSVNPAPVVVLDEVDAALDEANVGRFVDTLVELKDRTQFVVISHNRRTIEAADAIYGVSMGEDSTSQVLSLKLADLPQAS